MHNHTKGPWHIQHCSYYTAICSDERVIANMRYIDDSNEDDAKLIASAPDLLKERDDLLERVGGLLDKIDELHCQLAGCAVAALQNIGKYTPRRLLPGDYGHSASYDEVCRAVDREIAMREQRNELLGALVGCKELLEFLGPEVRGGYSLDGALEKARTVIAKVRGES